MSISLSAFLPDHDCQPVQGSWSRASSRFIGFAPASWVLPGHQLRPVHLWVQQAAHGFQLLPALIGLFAVAQIMSAFEDKYKEEDTSVREYKIKGFGFTGRI
jgi:hypothetical protein